MHGTGTVQGQANYAGDLSLSSSNHDADFSEAKTLKSAVTLLQPYITTTSDGAITFQPKENDNKLRSLSLSTTYIKTLSNLYYRDKSKSWTESLPILGFEISEQDTSDAYRVSSVKLGFLHGQLWVVFEPLLDAGESISLRWHFYW